MKQNQVNESQNPTTETDGSPRPAPEQDLVISDEEKKWFAMWQAGIVTTKWLPYKCPTLFQEMLNVPERETETAT